VTQDQVPLRRLFSSVTGGAWGADPENGEAVLPCIRGTDFDYTNLRTDLSRAPLRGFSQAEIAARAAKRGDLLIEKSGGGEQQPVGRVVLHDLDEPVMPTNFAGRLRPAPMTDSRFACYLLASLYSDGRTRATIKQTTGIQNLDLDAFLSFRVPRPSPGEQRAIANYLDAETDRIDALITKKRRMIDLFEERFHSLLERSLLGEATLETRNRWYPALGANRAIWRVKHLTEKIGSGRTPAGGAESYVRDGIMFLRSQNILMGHLSLGDVAFIDRDTDEDMRTTRVHPGDVLLNITGASLGRCSVTPEDFEPANVNQHVCIIRSGPGISGLLLHYALRARAVQEQIRQEQVGGNRDGMNFEQVGNLEVCLPTTPETWAELANQLAKAERTHRNSASTLRYQIELLAEHRQALITAAVNGKLDILGAAA
jgi:type I restriction enzyme, S subunit